jgi:hypothetical protein
MTEHDSNTQPNASLAPLNFVFACSVCCLTIADAYEGREETVQGLSDGINPKDRLVARTYLASCCHVFCGKHLEGGGTLRMHTCASISANTHSQLHPSILLDKGQRLRVQYA